MAGRVNTKFVFILTAVLTLLVVGFAALAYLSSRDVDTLIARAQQQQAEGEMKEAVETMERAAQRSKSDPAVIKQYIEMLKILPAGDQVEARNILEKVRGNTQNLTQIDPGSDELFQEYVDLIQTYIRQLGASQYAHPIYIYQVSNARLENNPDDGLARRYRGTNGFSRLNAEMPLEDIQQVGDDLRWAHQAYPEDPDVSYNLVRWNLFEAQRLDRPSGDPPLAKRLRDKALALVQASLEADPANPRRMLEHMQTVLSINFDPKADELYVESKPLIDELQAKLMADPQPQEVILMLLRYIKAVYAEDLIDESAQGGDGPAAKNQGVQRAVDLLKAASEAHPDKPAYRLMLGIELKLMGDFEQAHQLIESVRQLSTQGEYVQVLRNYNLRLRASIEAADLTMILASQPFSENQAEMFTRAGEILDEVTTAGLGETPRVMLLKGKLALVQNRVREGLVLIDEAAKLYDTFSREKAEALLLSARARAQQGDWGAAAQRYEQILDANAKLPSVRLQLANLYLQGQQYDKAQDHLDEVLSQDPLNEQALIVQASLLAAQDQFEQAIQTYRQMDLSNRPDLAVRLAQLMIQSGRKPQAAKVLSLYFEADPANLRLLSVLLSAVESQDRKEALIAQSRDAGADPKLLGLLERRLDPDASGDQAQMLADILEQEDDPFIRAISGARLYANAGDMDKSRSALAQAAELDPDHKTVIDMQFNFAIKDGDLDLAQRLADKAAQQNLDEASGQFYLAQVQSARKQYKQAIATLRLALEAVPINSEGWRLLGDMLAKDNNFIEAANAFDTALEQRPNNLGALRGLAAIRDRQGRHDEALRIIRTAYDQSPGRLQLRELYLSYEARHGDKQKTLRIRRELTQKRPEDYDNLRMLALLLAELEQAEPALKTMQAVVAAQGSTPVNLMALARIHQLSGDAPRGAEVLRQHIRDQGQRVQVKDHIMLARYLLQSGDSQGTLAAYEQAILLESDRREATRELAGLYFNRGVHDRAVPLYRDLYNQFPDETPLALRLADALIKIQQIDEASSILSSLGDVGSTGDALRALIEDQRGNHEAALQLVDAAIEAAPGLAVLYFERAGILSKDLQKRPQVLQDLNTALSLNPDHLLSRRMLAGILLQQGERREAIRELRTMVSRHPSYAEGRLQLIKVLTRDGDLTAARLLAKNGLSAAPQDPTWPKVLAGLAIQVGRYQDAIEYAQTVFDLAPTPLNLMSLTTLQVKHDRAAEALVSLRDNAEMVNQQPLMQALMGRALLATGKPEQARQVFVRSLERCTSFDQLLAVAGQVREDYSVAETVSLMQDLGQPPSRVWVELVLAQMELTDDQAQAASRRLAAIEPSLSAQDERSRLVFDRVMALALHGSGEALKALKVYQRLLEAQPDNISILNNMAYMLAQDLNRADEALPLAKRAAELESNNVQVLDTLGWVQFKTGQVDEAKLTLEKSIAIESLSANHLHLAEVLLDQGYKAQAGRHLKTAIDLAEQNNEPKIRQQAQELLDRVEQLSEASVSP